MQYLLMIYDNEDGIAALGEEKLGQIMTGYMAYTEALKKAGALVNSNRLRPVSTANSVRVQGGKTNVLNGPYAETKEQLGGYYLIDVPDLDTALSWAARCPGSEIGTIEVRPIWEM
ncbi:MAG TPA: YciI family protein [Rhizomicrobium sp.]|jgi:hypothetical protein